MLRQDNGYTLTELLLVTTISTLLLTVAVPALQDFQERNRAVQEITRLQMLLTHSREQAIHLQTRLTLCPLQNGRCSQNWNQPLSLFTDPNNNRHLDAGERIIATLDARSSDRVLRHFNNATVSFDSRGFAGHATGSFSYCLSGRRTKGAAFIISRNGRIRRGADADGDGIPETANGKNIPCPP